MGNEESSSPEQRPAAAAPDSADKKVEPAPLALLENQGQGGGSGLSPAAPANKNDTAAAAEGPQQCATAVASGETRAAAAVKLETMGHTPAEIPSEKESSTSTAERIENEGISPATATAEPQIPSVATTASAAQEASSSSSTSTELPAGEPSAAPLAAAPATAQDNKQETTSASTLTVPAGTTTATAGNSISTRPPLQEDDHPALHLISPVDSQETTTTVDSSSEAQHCSTTTTPADTTTSEVVAVVPPLHAGAEQPSSPRQQQQVDDSLGSAAATKVAAHDGAGVLRPSVDKGEVSAAEPAATTTTTDNDGAAPPAQGDQVETDSAAAEKHEIVWDDKVEDDAPSSPQHRAAEERLAPADDGADARETAATNNSEHGSAAAPETPMAPLDTGTENTETKFGEAVRASRGGNSIDSKEEATKAKGGEASSSSSPRMPATTETEMTGDSSPSVHDPLVGEMPSPVRDHDATVPTVAPEMTATRREGDCDDTDFDLPVVERPVDVHSITDTLLAASACVADNPTWTNLRKQPLQSSSRQAPVATEQPVAPVFRVARKRQRRSPGNCPARLHSYLTERYAAAPMMLFHLADDPPDDSTKESFDWQVVHFPWNGPGRQAMSETPSVSTLLRFCYAATAWLQSDPSSLTSLSSVHTRHSNSPIAIVSCENGKTRTAIAVACYLKFVGIVENVQSGFCHFLERRCRSDPTVVSPEKVLSDLPASLHTFFRNFDNAVELGEYMNRKPLLLKAISIQGVPVEDRPCVDVWDSSGAHVYSSHPHLWNDLHDTGKDNGGFGDDHSAHATTTETNPCRQVTSQWVDDEGFYRVNCLLRGDFCILCRFGGPYALDASDATKILFRYANSTAFMGPASPYELSCSRVDVQRRYAAHFEEEDFLLSLIVDGYWNASTESECELLREDCSKEVLPDILKGVEAMESGWHIIVEHHSAQPEKHDVDQLLSDSLGELDGCPRHIVSLALQLANFDTTMAQTILLEGRLRSWWQPGPDDYSIDERDQIPVSQTILDNLESLQESEALNKIQKLLSTVDARAGLDSIDPLTKRLLLNPKTEAESTDRSDHTVRVGTADSGTETTVAATPSPNFAYTSPIMRPHPGDIVATLSSSRVSSLLRSSNSFMGNHPLFPVVPKGRKGRGKPLPIEDPDNDAAMDLLVKLDHPGVDLRDLLDAAEKSREINASISRRGKEAVESSQSDAEAGEPHFSKVESASNPMAAATAAATAALTRRSATTDDRPKSTPPVGEQKSKEKGNAPTGIETETTNPAEAIATALAKRTDPPTSSSLSTRAAALAAAMGKRNSSGGQSENLATENDENSGDLPLKDDPAFQKYFKMRKMGLPDGAICNAMQRDDVDTSILDLDPEKSLKSQRGEAGGAKDEDVPIKDDPAFQKYFKMRKMGLPDGAIRNAMQRDDVDTSVLDLDPEKSLKSQRGGADGEKDEDVPIKDDPAFQKYFKMRKMGLPDGAIRNAMERDEVDASVLDLDLEKSLKSQTGGCSDGDEGVPIRDDPAFQKYLKMRKMGLPDGAIRNAMERDGVDPSVLDLDLEKSLKSQTKGGSDVDDGVPIKDDPALQKYFKMRKMGLPDGAIRNAMERDGVDSSVLDLDPEKSLKSQRDTEVEEENGVPLQDDPEWSKYFKMVKMGLPLGAAKNAVQRDGKDPSVLDLDPSKSYASQTNSDARRLPQRRKSSKRVRRKKIFWNPLDSKQISANSLWSHVKGKVRMNQLNYDEKEFEDLFTESTDAADRKKAKQKKESRVKKKTVQVIDGKRSMNGGIILARLKIDFKTIAEMVDQM